MIPSRNPMYSEFLKEIDDTLDAESVLRGRKRPDGVARGAHHIDIHGSGRDQTPQYIVDGGSYDIPYGALIAASLDNVLVAGRCVSSTREANGSARVSGTCIAMGHAVGLAAASAVDGDVRSLGVSDLRGPNHRDRRYRRGSRLGSVVCLHVDLVMGTPGIPEHDQQTISSVDCLEEQPTGVQLGPPSMSRVGVRYIQYFQSKSLLY